MRGIILPEGLPSIDRPKAMAAGAFDFVWADRRALWIRGHLVLNRRRFIPDRIRRRGCARRPYVFGRLMYGNYPRRFLYTLLHLWYCNRPKIPSLLAHGPLSWEFPPWASQCAQWIRPFADTPFFAHFPVTYARAGGCHPRRPKYTVSPWNHRQLLRNETRKLPVEPLVFVERLKSFLVVPRPGRDQ